MAYKRGTKGCVFLLYHPATGLNYRGAFSYRHATPHNVLWWTFFSVNPAIHALIRVFGAESFVVTVEQTFKTRNEAIDALKAFYVEERPQFNSMWLTDKRMPRTRPRVKKMRRVYPSYKGRNNPNYGHKQTALTKMKVSQGIKAIFVPTRWVVDTEGNNHKILTSDPLPTGWRYGRNTRNFSRW